MTVTQSIIFINIPTEPFIAIPRTNIVQVVFFFCDDFVDQIPKYHSYLTH